MTRSQRICSAALLFLISGFAALVYQVIWQRIIGVFSGVHIYSITIIVSAFMAGLGVGSLVAGRIADRITRRRAVLAFAICELLIGAFGWISAWLYYDVAYQELGFIVNYPVGLPLVHFCLLIFPTFLMGASLPLLARGLVEDSRDAASTIGVLYGVNTLGASLGAFTTIWWLVGSFGFEITLRGAAVLNLLAAFGAFWVQRTMAPFRDRSPASEAAAATAAPAFPSALLGWASAYALSGFIALSLEILWFRILDVTIKSSPYTFGHLLGVFLFFLACGSLVGSRTVRGSRRPAQVFLWGQWCISLSAGILILLLFSLLADSGPLNTLYSYWRIDEALEFHRILAAWEKLGTGNFPPILTLTALVYLVLPLVLLAVPVFLMGFTYAYIQRAVQTDPEQVGWRVGLIQAANIVGSILGSILTGVLLLNILGTPATLRLLVIAGAGFGLFAALRGAHGRRPVVAVLCVAISTAVAAAIPSSTSFWARLHGATTEEVVVVEDASSVVAMQTLRNGWAVLRVNGTGHSLLPYSGAHTLLGALPSLLVENPQDVLIVGLGTGTTAWAASCSPGVKSVDVFEIAAPEFEVKQRYLSLHPQDPAAREFQADPRMTFHFSDGRLALRTQQKKYDVIEADALEPYMAYSGNLYSREFFQEVRAALRPGGAFCTYAPTDRTRRTLLEVFPHVLFFEGKNIPQFMIASNEPLSFDRKRIIERLQSSAFKKCSETATHGSKIAKDLEALARIALPQRFGPASDPAQFGPETNSDLFPRDEYDKRTGSAPLRGRENDSYAPKSG